LPDILDSLVALTAQRERRTLEISLLTTLRELLKDCTVALYNCRWIDGHPWWRIQLDSLDELPQQNQPWTLPGSKMLRILLQQDERQDVYSTDTGLCLPLYQANQVVAVLMITPHEGCRWITPCCWRWHASMKISSTCCTPRTVTPSPASSTAASLTTSCLPGLPSSRSAHHGCRILPCWTSIISSK
jgi:hypothetical protein